MTRARDKANLTQVATTSEPSPLTAGMVWLDTDATTTNVFEQRWRKSYSSAVTTISGADDYYLTLSYTVGFEKVFLNGVLLTRGVDYTATDGTSIVLGSATNVGDYIDVVTTSTFTAANTYTQSAANATFPLNTSAFFAGKNKIINGDFYVNQRAFSSTSTNNWTFDRWQVQNGSSGGTMSAAAQTFTPGTAPVSGYEGKNYMRLTSASQSGVNDYAAMFQPVEDVRNLSGQTTTVSFWAKAASGTPTVWICLEQNYGTGGAGTVARTNGSVTISTTWQRYSVTLNNPSLAGKTIGATNSLTYVWLFTSIGSGITAAGYPSGFVQNAIIDFWGVQWEAGSVATAFQTATGTIQGELAACQRYYQRISSDATSSIAAIQLAVANSATSAMSILSIPTMRTIPTVGYSALGNFYLSDLIASANYTTTGIGISTIRSTPSIVFINQTVASGLTTGRVYSWQANTTSTYLDLSAEL